MERMVSPGQKASTDDKRVDAALDDLRHWHGVRAWCTACGHHSWIKVDDLRKRWGGQMLFSEVERKMTCIKCRKGRIRLEVHTVNRG